jgi:glycosyltransferase involved in cell wall biosynthesis/ubiquinone/menaquinone biosynthesis C-methylase UbiE
VSRAALYVLPSGEFGHLEEPRLETASARHRIIIPPPTSVAAGDVGRALRLDTQLAGIVLEMASGCPTAAQMRLVDRTVALDRQAWLYWSEEGVIECITPERRSGYRRLGSLLTFYTRVRDPLAFLIAIPRRIAYVLRDVPTRTLPKWAIRRAARTRIGLRVRRFLRDPRLAPPVPLEQRPPEQPSGPSPMQRHAQRLGAIRAARKTAKPVPFSRLAHPPGPAHRISGCGVYLRTDFWSPIVSGGSYGHTCYVAKELAAVTESFVCCVANPFPLLDELGVLQHVMPKPSDRCDEDVIASATPFYVDLLRPMLEERRAAYIYERLCLGNYAGALLSAGLRIPYILEYNGSEVSMRRSFEGTAYVFEAEILEAEAFAFEQATMISVVSAEISRGLVARGVDPAKIFVNPNGVDLTAYAPAPPEARESIRRSLGFEPQDRVVGFTGTFGGWHGIDVLSDAIPRICLAEPRARFLLIGDGHFKQLVDHAVTSYGLEKRVISTGRVPQAEGARLLTACDIYVSPHSTHMVDSKFFGSPTKIFEYMALGGGIVASDLEQIGEVLSPALSPRAAAEGTPTTDERSVLCVPGDVDEFVLGVIACVHHPEVAQALGRNARQAAVDHYSWERHVAKLWQFLSGDLPTDADSDLRRKRKLERVAEPVLVGVGGAATAAGAATAPRLGEAEKLEVQRQWNNDPAGSHYVTEAAPHTLAWFLEAENYRYGQYAPWMKRTMEFDRQAGQDVLEIGGGMGTDLAQFALHGARVTDVDLSSGHLKLAKENFAARGLEGRFILQDAESLVFDENAFDLVYSNGVIHHTPNTRQVVSEIFRVLRPGGRAIVMVYAENSLFYWRSLVWLIGIKVGQLRKYSMGEILSRSVERNDRGGAKPLVKVYTRRELRQLFGQFEDVEILQRQLVRDEVPSVLRLVPLRALERLMGWNLIVKARKPAR